jgi:hypothetical protein
MEDFFMLLDYVLFNGSNYPIRTIKLKNKEYVNISTIDLDNLLFDKNEQYISDIAKHIDEYIFFFVENDEILLPEKVLSELVFQEALA